jgi:hypothetical protein
LALQRRVAWLRGAQGLPPKKPKKIINFIKKANFLFYFVQTTNFHG